MVQGLGFEGLGFGVWGYVPDGSGLSETRCVRTNLSPQPSSSSSLLLSSLELSDTQVYEP